jgi:hypothetical protein
MERKSRQNPLLISCGILQPEIEALIEGKEIEAEAIFLNKYLHTDYQKLHDALTASLRKHSRRKSVVIYGDVCMGFNGEMNALMTEYDVVKVDALNCIDCLLGGRGNLLEREKDKSNIQSLNTGYLAVSKTGDISHLNILTGALIF